LRAWNDHYGADLETVPVAWNREGLALAQELQKEFDARGISVEVLYHDNLDEQERPVRHLPRG
jgi:hypothetical protein